MGFKHTMLQRLNSFEVAPARTTPEAEQPPVQIQITDFSINRILSDDKPRVKTPKPSSKVHTASTMDILDLSKTNQSAQYTSTTLSPSAALYPGLNSDFFAAAAAANASKFYAQFFPHLLPAYAAAAAVNVAHITTPPNSPYQKRYFAPYVLNSTSTGTRLVPPATATVAPIFTTLTPASVHPKSLSSAVASMTCTRSDCFDCLDYYKQLAYKPTPVISTNTSSNSSISTRYMSSKSSTDLLFNTSTISLTTVTNLNLTGSATSTQSTRKLSAFDDHTNTVALTTEEISYKCRICDKVFGCCETLQSHEKTHKSPRYECTDCGKGFSQLRNYKYHLSVHRGTKEFAAECPECGKTFNDKGYLSSHMKIHRNKKEYECPYCPKSFNQRVAFNMHVRIHTGVKPHKCAECGKRFSRKMLLKQHMRTHSGEKPYQCSVCGKSFADRSNMTLHHRLHSGIKPFSCPLCPKAFTKKHHLKTHLNYHTGCKPYVCPHPNCNQAFTQSSNMRTHAKKCQHRPLDMQFSAASTTIMPTTVNSNSNLLNNSMPRISLPIAQTYCNTSASGLQHMFAITSNSSISSNNGSAITSNSSISSNNGSGTANSFTPTQQQPLMTRIRPF